MIYGLPLLFLAFFLRVAGSFQSFWLDEGITAYAVKTMPLSALLTDYLKGDFHPPLYFAMLWLWTRLFGFSEFAIRFPSIVFGALTVFVVFLIGKRFSYQAGFLSAFFMALSGYHIYYSHEARMYSMGAFFASLSLYFLLRVVGEGRLRWWVGLFISCVFSLYTDYLLLFWVAALSIFLFVRLKRIFLRRVLIFYAGLVASFLPWVPFLIEQFRQAMATAGQYSVWGDVVGGATFKNLALLFVKFTIGRITFANREFYAVYVLLFCAIFWFVIGYGTLRNFRRSALFLYFFLFVVTTSFIVSFVAPLFTPFRLLYLLVVVYLLLGNGLVLLPLRLRVGAVFILIFLSSFSLFQYYSRTDLQREDWRGLASYLQQNVTYDDGVYILNPVSWPLRFYTNDEMELSDYKSFNNQGYATLWLVSYAQPIYEPGNETRTKIEGAGYRVYLVKHFNEVTLYAYRR